MQRSEFVADPGYAVDAEAGAPSHLGSEAGSPREVRQNAFGITLHRFARPLTLSNWPFALKMAFSPALAVIVLVGMGLFSMHAAETQASLIRAVVQQDLIVAKRLSESAIRLEEINSNLYRLTTLQAARTGNLNVSDRIARLVAKTSALAGDLDSQAGTIASDTDRADLVQVVADVRLYRDAIDVFGSMLEIDFASAVEFFGPFDQNAAKVLRRITVIANRALSDASSRAAFSTLLAERIGLSLAIAFVAGSLLLFGTSALLTRATVRSVKRIAAATEQVAQGGSEIAFGTLARGDELGIIVESLAVFQSNVSRIAFLGHHDALTRLPNRVLFHDRIQQALTQVGRGTEFAVLCLDLDRFKIVNDTLGHPVGDGLLRQVADRLQACVREGDTVARLGGDEFAVILLNVSGPSEVDALAARIIEVVGSSYEVDGYQIDVGTSIGMALCPEDGSISEELLKKADTALYEAKTIGGSVSCFYEDSMNVALQSRRQLELELRRAIALDEFEVYYQPLVDARTHRVTSFEALIRWRHPERGLTFPDVFIPIAEASGLIGVIGQWVLRQACRDATTWAGDIKVAVNLSPSQFKDKHLAGYVRGALDASGLCASRLELEITESVLLQESTDILATLFEIKALGVQISMDDFGTGYSSLSYLRSFPFDKIKIDRSFIRDLPDDESAMAIVRAIVGLGETLGMKVTAEGVETNEQAVQLALARCHHLQGYLFSKAIPAARIPALIEQLTTQSATNAVSA